LPHSDGPPARGRGFSHTGLFASTMGARSTRPASTLARHYRGRETSSVASSMPVFWKSQPGRLAGTNTAVSGSSVLPPARIMPATTITSA